MTKTSRQILIMSTVAALCAAPMLAFGQQSGAGGSQAPSTIQPAPRPGPGVAPTTMGGTAQIAPRDGMPGNPPSTATGRAADAVTGQRTDPDGTGSNPPGTVVGRAIDRATGGAPATATDTTRPGSAATTGAGLAGVDSARIIGGRRASKLIGSNVYNENNEAIGEVDDIIIPDGAATPVAILSVGGFLGIGARLVAVPYERLQHAADRDRWMLRGATKDSLRTLPEFRYDSDTVPRRG